MKSSKKYILCNALQGILLLILLIISLKYSLSFLSHTGELIILELGWGRINPLDPAFCIPFSLSKTNPKV
jgi:hypothetical protein